MTVFVELPSEGVQYVLPDGRLTIEGLKLFQRLVDAIEDLDTRLTTAEATIADHETRITALEP